MICHYCQTNLTNQKATCSQLKGIFKCNLCKNMQDAYKNYLFFCLEISDKYFWVRQYDNRLDIWETTKSIYDDFHNNYRTLRLKNVSPSVTYSQRIDGNFYSINKVKSILKFKNFQ